MKKIVLSLLLLGTAWTGVYCQRDQTEIKLGIRQVSPEAPLAQEKVARPVAVCQCAGNIVRDAGMATPLTFPGTSDISPASPIWKSNTGSPQYSATRGCCNNGFIAMWGNQVIGESIVQSGLNIIAGRKYRIKFCARFANGDTVNTFVRFKFIAFQGLSMGYNTNIGVIGISPNISSTAWNAYTLADWVAPQNYSSIQIHPENNSAVYSGAEVSWGHIDNICIEEIPCNCGRWGAVNFVKSGMVKSLTCGQKIVVKEGEAWSINPAYSCSAGCESKITGTLSTPSGQILNISFPYTFTATELCNYKLTLTATCGDRRCSSCSIGIFSTIGCPGEVITPPVRDPSDFDPRSQAQ